MSSVFQKPHFDLFSLPQSFSVDLDLLEKNYLALSQHFHPDTVAQGTTREKLEATIKTADLNNAYETLKDTLKRGYYLLTLIDPIAKDDQEHTIKHPALLMEAMEDREALEDATSAEQITALTAQTKAKKEQTLTEIKDAFETQNLEAARLALYKFRYYDKFISDANKELKNHALTA